MPLKNLVNSHLQFKALIPDDIFDEFIADDSVEVSAGYASFQDLVAAERFIFLPELYPKYNLQIVKANYHTLKNALLPEEAVSEQEYQLLR